ncbi:MAG TPA: hypothetical protein VFA27_11340 [Vicinamibacterales bacterium]|nr:hypothetical protein [Vicinamibacterales bacterium]
MRRVFNDAMVSVGALLALLMLLVAIDGRVREQVMLRVSGGYATGDVAAAEHQMRDLANVMIDAIHDAVRLHTTLTIFVVVATVLTVFMVRT